MLKGSESNRGEDIVFLNAESPNDCAAAERIMAAEAGSPAAWVLQRYVTDPMLVGGKYKFHLRVMVLAAGDLKVYLHDNAVALRAAESLFKETSVGGPTDGGAERKGGERGELDMSNIFAHATNHCVQKRHASAEHVAGGVMESKSLTLPELCRAVPLPPSHPTPDALLEHVREQLREVVADLFRAARSKATAAVGFFPLENTFELFGLDFLLDASGKAWLLEVNADPSLAVFGDRLRPRCDELVRDVLDVALPVVVGAHEMDGQSGRNVDAPIVGGFTRVLDLPPRFEDGAEGRRRVSKLISLMGSLTAATYTTHTAREGKVRSQEQRGRSREDQSSNDGGPGAREEAAVCGGRMASVSLGAPGSAGVAAALGRFMSRSGAPLWAVTSNPKAPVCALQWGPYRVIRWERVMDDGQCKQGSPLVANHYYSRAGLLRPVELSTVLAAAGATGLMPATVKLSAAALAAAGSEVCATALETMAGGACRWRATSPPSSGPHVDAVCESAAEAVNLVVSSSADVDSEDNEGTTAVQSIRRGEKWSLQQVVEDGLQTVHASVLVLGALRVELHRCIHGLNEVVAGSLSEAAAARTAVASTIREVILTAAKNRRCFLPFPNCFEVFSACVLLAREDDGCGGTRWRAWLMRFDDPFAEKTDVDDEDRRASLDDLAADAVTAATEHLFFSGERGAGLEQGSGKKGKKAFELIYDSSGGDKGTAHPPETLTPAKS